MFEIDENTKYSLRLLGRGSLILVSLALILAIIGYYQSDSNNAGTIPEMAASDFVELEKKQLYALVKQRILITSDADSFNIQQTKVQIFPSESEVIIQGLLKEPVGPGEIEKKQKIVLSGTFVGFSDGIYSMKNCALK
ncbi:MAG: hypothetical protein ACQESZ_03795 [Bacteroidota bacterium]